MTGAPTGPSTLIGRIAELERGDRIIDGVLGGHGALLLISGEAGIGKTALATAIGQRAQARGAALAIGHCYESAGMPAFESWQELLDELRNHGLQMAGLPPPFGDSAASRTDYELLQAVTRAVLASAQQQPLMLWLEDVHWADPDTLELLWFLSRQLRSAPILMLATFRPEYVQREHPLSAILPHLQHDCPIDSLRVTEFSADETAHLIESICGPCHPELAAHLNDRADGNPFYVGELLRDLQEQHLLARDAEGRWMPPAHAAGVPSIVQHTVLQRVARLGADAEALLTVAAVVGQEWELAVVEAVLGWDEARLLGAMQRLITTYVVMPTAAAGETYSFAHSLPREVLYDQLLARRRRQLHQQVAAVLELRLARTRDQAVHAVLANQFAAAEDWPKAVHYALSAGDWSRARNATHTALRFYELARDAIEHLDPNAIGTVDEHVALRLSERIAKLHMVLNRLGSAEREFTHTIEIARGCGNRVAEAEALAWQSLIRARMNRMAEATATAETALQLATETSDSRLRALAERSVAHLLVVCGDLEPAAEHAKRGEQFARAGHNQDVLGPCLYDLALMAVWRGDYELAERLASEALDLADSGHDVPLYTSACLCLGLGRTERGHYLAARDILQLGLEAANEAGERRNIAKLLNTLGALHEELGDFETARQWNHRALDATRVGHDASVLEAERYTLLNLASTELHSGDVAEAEHYLYELEPLLDLSQYARFRYLNRFQLLRAEVAVVKGDTALAKRWAEEAQALAEAKQIPKNVAKSLLLAGRALLAGGSAAAAAEQLQRAVAVADGVQHAALGWQSRFWLGQALQARRSTHASDLYREAVQRVDAIAAELTDRRLQECFMSSALVQAVRTAGDKTLPPAKLNHPAGLSDREVDVLRLVASGTTNAQIAEALSISPRTVAVHVTSILNKTGCANRAAAVGFALRHGIT